MTAAARDVVLQQRFEAILARDLDRMRRAMVARFGAEIGREATADAVAWAWAHAEEHGQRRAEESQLLGHELLDGQAEHDVTRPGS